MNFEKHISDLLFRYQCVIVPGFGAFLTKETSAIIDVENNVFNAPTKLISFNANLKNNDGLLANRISDSEKISFDNALNLISLEVEKLWSALNNENFVSLKNIGDFSLNNDKNLVFNPTENFNYLTTSFGLTTFNSPDVKRQSAIVATTPTIITKTLVNEPYITPEQPQKTRKYSNLKYAAVFLIGCGIVSPVFINLYKERTKINNLNVQANVQKIVNSKIQEATFVINPLEKLGAGTDVFNYHVVAGAFKIEANADKRCSELIANGFKAKKISKNNNDLYPVIYGSYTNYGDARNAMMQIQKNNNNPEAWVLIQELEK